MNKSAAKAASLVVLFVVFAAVLLLDGAWLVTATLGNYGIWGLGALTVVAVLGLVWTLVYDLASR